MYRIFHGKHRILLSTEKDSVDRNTQDFVIKKPSEEQIKEVLRVSKSSTKALKILFIGNPDKLLKKVFFGFKYVVASGGIVQNKNGEILLMKRLGKWDLPKGKIKKGEDLQVCAIREIEEETGVKKLSIETPFSETYHTYYRNEKWEIKHTYWYIINSKYEGPLTPQVEEDIHEVRWVSISDLGEYIADTYPAIKRLIKAYINHLKLEDPKKLL